MLKRLTILTLFSVALLMSCKKDDSPEPTGTDYSQAIIGYWVGTKITQHKDDGSSVSQNITSTDINYQITADSITVHNSLDNTYGTGAYNINGSEVVLEAGSTIYHDDNRYFIESISGSNATFKETYDDPTDNRDYNIINLVKQ